MAKKNVAPGVTREDFHWGYMLEGRKEALLAAGLAKHEWFPDGVQRNNRGGIIRTVKFEHEGRGAYCRQERKNWFLVGINYSEEERDRWHEASELREEYEKALTDEKKEIAHMPTSHEQYREKSVRRWEIMFEERFTDIFGPHEYHGFSYAPEVLAAVDLKMAEIRGILETGRTLYSAERQQARIAEVRAKVAAADPDVRAFLDRVTGQR
jgi:hypothetical protein